MKSTISSTGEVIDFASREHMAAPAAGHNGPPHNAPIDWGRVFRWSILNSELSPIASLICHTIGALYDKDGQPVWPSIKWISLFPVSTYRTDLRESVRVVSGTS